MKEYCTLELNDGFVWWFFNYDKSNGPGFADGQWSLPLPPPPPTKLKNWG